LQVVAGDWRGYVERLGVIFGMQSAIYDFSTYNEKVDARIMTTAQHPHFLPLNRTITCMGGESMVSQVHGVKVGD
jgi:hypothetical protein